MKYSWHFLCRWTVVVLFTFTALAQAQVIFDDFNDGNDDGWEQFSPLDMVGASSVFSFPEVGAVSYTHLSCRRV